MSYIPSTKPRTALVTGATSGIGHELAALLAADRVNLVLVARGAADLDRVAAKFRLQHGVAVETMPLDLAVAGAADAIAARLTALDLTIDTLVNNAGFAGYGPFADSELAHEVAMIQVNVVALTHLTKLVLPGMLVRRHGHILNVASTAAFMPGPLMAVYYASKAYVLSFSEALAEEVRGSGVSVTALCPGPTATGFQKRAAMEESKLVSGRKIMDAATVARVGYAGMLAGKRVVVPGGRDRLLVQATRFLPGGVLARMVHRAQERVAH